MMVVRSVNNVFPDFAGNVNTINTVTKLYGSSGVIGDLKVAAITATTSGTDGTWSVNYASVGFTSVVSVQATVLAGSFSMANAPLSTNVGTITNTSCTGKAFKATSAGLLTAMQQTPVEAGTQIMVLIIGV